VLVLFTADWCPPCRRLKRDVLGRSGVDAYLEEQFVRVKIDLTDRSGPNNAVAAHFGVRSIPSARAYDPDGHEIGVYQGSYTEWEFLDWLRECRTWVPAS
jgi:protein disulfide-isomerase